MGAIIKRGTKHAPKFYAQYTDANAVRRTKLLRGATSTEHARTMLAEIERNIMHGRLGIEEPTDADLERRRLTVRQLGAKFLAEYSNPKVKDLRRYRKEARWKIGSRINPRLGDRAVSSLGVVDLERFRDELLAPPVNLAPASVTRTLALLSKMFAWGRKCGIVELAENPTRGCTRPTAASTIDYLSLDEVRSLLATAEDHGNAFCTPSNARMLFVMVATAIYTGMRRGELFGLRWTDVRLDAAQLDVARSYARSPKSGKARHLPIHPALLPILRRWKKQTQSRVNPGNLVFPIDEGRGVRMGNEKDTLGLPEMLTAAGCHAPIDGHFWHLLRHSFASHFMMAGGNILTLQKLLGHATLAMTMVYAHLSPDHLAAELARMTFSAAPAGVADIDEERRRRVAANPYVEGTSDDPNQGSSECDAESRALAVSAEKL